MVWALGRRSARALILRRYMAWEHPAPMVQVNESCPALHRTTSAHDRIMPI